MILYDSLKLLKMTPNQYVKLVIDNISRETDEQTIMYIISKLNYIMTNFIQQEDKADLSRDLWNVLHKIFTTVESSSLFNLVFDSAVRYGEASSNTDH